MSILGRGIFKAQAPRRFSYRPVYYDIRKDSAVLEERKRAVFRNGSRDPLLHGETMYERMAGTNDPLYEQNDAAWEAQMVWVRRVGIAVMGFAVFAGLYRFF
jgi:hypothetical protein